jgi:hypothetical protein
MENQRLLKKVSMASFLNAVKAPPYIPSEMSLNIVSDNVQMWYDGFNLIIHKINPKSNLIGEVIVPCGNISSMVILPE